MYTANNFMQDSIAIHTILSSCFCLFYHLCAIF